MDAALPKLAVEDNDSKEACADTMNLQRAAEFARPGLMRLHRPKGRHPGGGPTCSTSSIEGVTRSVGDGGGDGASASGSDRVRSMLRTGRTSRKAGRVPGDVSERGSDSRRSTSRAKIESTCCKDGVCGRESDA